VIRRESSHRHLPRRFRSRCRDDEHPTCGQSTDRASQSIPHDLATTRMAARPSSFLQRRPLHPERTGFQYIRSAAGNRPPLGVGRAERNEQAGGSDPECRKVLGVTQPNVSALRHYKLAGFSIEPRMNLLTAPDQDVEIVIRQKRRSRKVARLSHAASWIPGRGVADDRMSEPSDARA
jgi:hypothetical protein